MPTPLLACCLPVAASAAGPAHRRAAARIAAGPAARWPATANPYLLINQSTGGGTCPVRRSYIQATVRKVEITAQELRADRLLAEAQASGGDPLKLTHLFGISDPTAIRYCAELGPLEPGTHPGPALPGR